MKVWWCEEHQSSDSGIISGLRECHKRLWYMACDDPDLPLTPCRMVEMQLVPADALVVKKENGEWPTLLIMELADLLAFESGDVTVEYHEARRFLDSLFVASVSKATT